MGHLGLLFARFKWEIAGFQYFIGVLLSFSTGGILVFPRQRKVIDLVPLVG